MSIYQESMRNIFNRTSLGLLLLLLICVACREQKSSTQLERAYAALEGSHITFPDNMQLTYEGKDTVINHHSDANFKLVIYRDSLSCNQCYVETFSDWEKLINEYDSCFNKKLDFVFILSPLSKNEEDLRLNILGMEFKHPIYFDRKGSFQKANPQIPRMPMLQVFLLDKNNQVIMIGDPLANKGINQLLRKKVQPARDNPIRYNV